MGTVTGLHPILALSCVTIGRPSFNPKHQFILAQLGLCFLYSSRAGDSFLVGKNISDIIHGLNRSCPCSLWHCLRFSSRWFFQSSLKRLIQLQLFPSRQDYHIPSCERSRLFLRRHSCSPICSPVFAITKPTKLLLIVSPLLDHFMISATFCSRVHDCHAWRF